MSLKITSSDPTMRERILAYGLPGTGKSYMWQCILAATPDDVQFHVIDTDATWEAAKGDERFGVHEHRVHLYEPETWPDYIEAIQSARELMDRKRGDWFVLDLGDRAWESVQAFYEARKFQGDMNSLEFIYKVVDGTIDEEISGKNTAGMWGAINRLYGVLEHMLVKAPGHVFVTATEKDFKKDGSGNYWQERKQDVRSEYSAEGVRPGGQKSLGHDVRTSLHLIKRGSKREFKVIKDRNREHKWEGKLTRPHNDIALDLLMAIAGWVPVEEE